MGAGSAAERDLLGLLDAVDRCSARRTSGPASARSGPRPAARPSGARRSGRTAPPPRGSAARPGARRRTSRRGRSTRSVSSSAANTPVVQVGALTAEGCSPRSGRTPAPGRASSRVTISGVRRAPSCRACTTARDLDRRGVAGGVDVDREVAHHLEQLVVQALEAEVGERGLHAGGLGEQLAHGLLARPRARPARRAEPAGAARPVPRAAAARSRRARRARCRARAGCARSASSSGRPGSPGVRARTSRWCSHARLTPRRRSASANASGKAGSPAIDVPPPDLGRLAAAVGGRGP